MGYSYDADSDTTRRCKPTRHLAKKVVTLAISLLVLGVFGGKDRVLSAGLLVSRCLRECIEKLRRCNPSWEETKI